MSVTSILEDLQRTAAVTIESERSYTRVLHCITDDKEDDALLVYQAVNASIPIGSTYSTANASDTGAILVNIDVSPLDDPKDWEATLTYESRTVDPDQQNNDPTQRNPIYKVGFRKERQVLEQDKDGEALVNSALQPFDPPIEIEKSIAVIQVETWKTVSGSGAFTFADIEAIQDAVNDDTWNGFASGTCKCIGADATEVYENDTRLWKLNYTVEYKPEGWLLSLLDAGYYILDPTEPTEYRQIVDTMGVPVSKPALLDGNGEQLPATGTPVYLEFRPFDYVTFADHISEWVSP